QISRKRCNDLASPCCRPGSTARNAPQWHGARGADARSRIAAALPGVSGNVGRRLAVDCCARYEAARPRDVVARLREGTDPQLLRTVVWPVRAAQAEESLRVGFADRRSVARH